MNKLPFHSQLLTRTTKNGNVLNVTGQWDLLLRSHSNKPEMRCAEEGEADERFDETVARSYSGTWKNEEPRQLERIAYTSIADTIA